MENVCSPNYIYSGSINLNEIDVDYTFYICNTVLALIRFVLHIHFFFEGQFVL